MLAIAENNLVSSVRKGENAGRQLPHTAVVRSLRAIGKTRPGEPFRAEVQPPLAKSWKPADLHAVVFLQDRSSRRISGAAAAPLMLP